MWTTINGFDRTNSIEPGPIEAHMTLSDPLPTLNFSVDDPGCLIDLQELQEVILWDETQGPTFVPGNNFIVNPAIGGFTNWTGGGSLLSLILANTPQPFAAQATLANSATASTGFYSQMTQAGQVKAGQTYCFSWWSTIATTLTGANAFGTIAFYDSTQTIIAGASTTATYTTTGGVLIRKSVSAVAPSNALYAVASWGINTTSATNSGMITWGPGSTGKTVFQLEPCLFLAQGVSYPTPGMDFFQISNTLATVLPDGTSTRRVRLFSGYINDLIVTYEGNNRTWQVQCAGSGAILENVNLLNLNYSDPVFDSSIINTILSTSYAGILSGGSPFTTAAATIVKGVQIPAGSFADQTFRDILNSLTDQSNYIYFVDPYFYLHYNPLFWDVAAVEISTDSPNSITSFAPREYQLEKDATSIKNRVKVTGASQVYPTQVDTFSGNGIQKSFPLTFSPKTITSSSVGKVGVDGVNTFAQGYAGLIDKGGLALNTNTAPASGTNNVTITYSYEAPVAVQVQSLDSFAKYQRYFDSKVNDTSLTSTDAATSRGIAEVSKNELAKPILTFKTDQPFSVGQIVFFTSAHDHYNRQPFVVQEVYIHSLGAGINEWTLTVGAYIPNVIDSIRNSMKAINKAQTTANTNAPLQIDLVVSDTLAYSDSMTVTSVASPAAAVYGVAIYGFSSFQ